MGKFCLGQGNQSAISRRSCKTAGHRRQSILDCVLLFLKVVFSSSKTESSPQSYSTDWTFSTPKVKNKLTVSPYIHRIYGYFIFLYLKVFFIVIIIYT